MSKKANKAKKAKSDFDAFEVLPVGSKWLPAHTRALLNGIRVYGIQVDKLKAHLDSLGIIMEKEENSIETAHQGRKKLSARKSWYPQPQSQGLESRKAAS
jgi:hypothetical protein